MFIYSSPVDIIRTNILFKLSTSEAKMRNVVNIAEMLNKLLVSLWAKTVILLIKNIFYQIGVRYYPSLYYKSNTGR